MAKKISCKVVKSAPLGGVGSSSQSTGKSLCKCNDFTAAVSADSIHKCTQSAQNTAVNAARWFRDVLFANADLPLTAANFDCYA
ncbi:MAG: hypothetical protein KAI59_06555 [Planctomycetes bacterium]|nr:hypothetical protein [Planctomycetota bacterium]MCK5473677.1 hypothetical protein [Planctomycetota bacterium]